jgi:hypothetical protein
MNTTSRIGGFFCIICVEKNETSVQPRLTAKKKGHFFWFNALALQATVRQKINKIKHFVFENTGASSIYNRAANLGRQGSVIKGLHM